MYDFYGRVGACLTLRLTMSLGLSSPGTASCRRGGGGRCRRSGYALVRTAAPTRVFVSSRSTRRTRAGYVRWAGARPRPRQAVVEVRERERSTGCPSLLCRVTGWRKRSLRCALPRRNGSLRYFMLPRRDGSLRCLRCLRWAIGRG